MGSVAPARGRSEDREDEEAGTVTDEMSQSEERWSEKRAAMRHRTFKDGKIVFDEDQCIVDCTVKNVSRTGARLMVDAWFDCPNEVELRVSDGAIFQCVVVRQIELELGVHFIDADS